MREHKYKAKRLDNGEWIEGYYWQNSCGNHFIRAIDEQGEFILIDVEIDPDTLCEFTGLTDKNDKYIWENDIVKIQHFTNRPYSKYAKEKQFNGYVYWKESKFNGNSKYKEQIYAGKWDVKINQDIGAFSYGSWGRLWNCKVIGNIFDNPELLEVK